MAFQGLVFVGDRKGTALIQDGGLLCHDLAGSKEIEVSRQFSPALEQAVISFFILERDVVSAGIFDFYQRGGTCPEFWVGAESGDGYGSCIARSDGVGAGLLELAFDDFP